MTDEVWKVVLNQYIVPFRHLGTGACPPTFIGHKDSEPLLDKKLFKYLWSLPVDMNIDIYSNGLLLPKWAEQGRDVFENLAKLHNHCRFLLSYHPFNHDYSVNYYGHVVEYLHKVLRSKPPNVEVITVSHESKWVPQVMQNAWKAEWQKEEELGLITVHCNSQINPWTGRIESDFKFHYCPYEDFNHLFFGVTGNVIACCMDLEEEIVFGNVMEDSPTEMFNKVDQFYYRQRMDHWSNHPPKHQVCYNCFGLERTDNPQLVQLGVRNV